MKEIPKVLLVIVVFAAFALSTSVRKRLMEDYPCYGVAEKYLWERSTHYASWIDARNDTIVIRSEYDSAWDAGTEALCRILADSCNVYNRKILVVDTSRDQTQYNTPWGKQIYLRQCP